ncbi:cation:proton antiporter [Niastella koreensis]|uniref:Sodium/hydrogen exchanger n=2 Tax=Niastella koreensis TaxID=354356 RepID=G8TFW8_NIAKG|nr:cation:proton antiporter [Niastella koreensis]AEW00567.1 sodium/hydrogen exchanger [Niastella koreensis GR20-10]OQP52426.1 cation:proton antiporter [Niastella koreensis]
MNTVLATICLACLVILLLILLLKKIGQPYLIAYLIAGVLLRPVLSGLIPGNVEVEQAGQLGLLFLMFFLGMEMKIPDERSLLLKPVIAQSIKILLSIGFAFLLGYFFHLKIYYTLTLAALFNFNSTAIVGEYLSRNKELNTSFGTIILNILLLQDLMVAPTTALFRFMGVGAVSVGKFIVAILVCAAIIILLRAVRYRAFFRSSMLNGLKSDHELQVFLGLLLSLGFGALADVAGLNSAIGSFVAGLCIGRTVAFNWLEHSLQPFRVFFVALFFMTIGLQFDLEYLLQHGGIILGGALLVLVSNSLLSAIVFRLLGYDWQQSLYAGALLAHTGEFGLMACSLAYNLHAIDSTFYKAAIAITGTTLLLSATWINILKLLSRAAILRWQK